MKRARRLNDLAPRWLSAKQIADLALDGLPTSARRVREQASREEWKSKDRKGKGGGQLFSVAHLPASAVADLNERLRKRKRRTGRSAGRPAGSDFFTRRKDIAEAVTAWLAARKLSAGVLLENIHASFDEAPSLRTLQRFVAGIEDSNELVLQSLRDPNAFKGTRRLSIGRADAGITFANQRWELDTTPGDVLLVEGRRAILGVIDVFSRRVRFLVMPSESAQSVRRLLAETMQAWGTCPTEVATDQGSGYVNQAVTSALELLGIVHKPCPPASPEKKPHIERVFGTFQRARAEVLAGYCGHNVAEAQRLRERARKETGKPLVVPEMTVGELQAVLDNWADGPYLQSRHSGIGTTPLAKWQSSPEGAARAPTADELRIVLSAKVGTRMVGKRGIEWKRGRYWSPALAAYVGRQVMVRRDEDELGELMIFDEDGHFIDVAINHQRSGLSEEQFARQARRDQEKWMKAARADMRDKMRRYTIEGARENLLRHDAELAGKLVTLPTRTEDRPSQTIRSIRERPEIEHTSQEQLRDIDRRSSKPAPSSERAVEDKMAEADTLIADFSRGREVDTERLRWARLYVQGSEYRTAKVMAAHFGPQADDEGQTIHRNTAGNAG